MAKSYLRDRVLCIACLSGRAGCRHSLHLHASYCRSVKAVIQARENLTNHAAPAIKVRYAQEADFAKL